MALTAVLTGTYRNPELRFKFGWGATLPNGKSAQDWIKKLPGRRWDNSEKTWYITGTGINPDKFFANAKIDVDFSEATGDLAGLTSLESLWRPLFKRSSRFPHLAFVRPRMAGFERVSGILGPGAVWDKTRQRFEVMLADLVTDAGEPKRGLQLDPDTWEAAVAARQLENIPEDVRAAARELASSTGVEGDFQDELSPRTQELIDTVATHTGYLPKWFGLALYPFQVAGAYAIAGGHRALADAPGLGKGSPDWVKILTPTGWTTYGDIQLGDQVIGSDGLPTKVIGVYPRGVLDVFKVTMNDGSSVVVDGDHLWEIQNHNEKQGKMHSRVRSTREIMETDLRNQSEPHRRFTTHIPVVKPVEFAPQGVLPLHPYVMGMLLGDGHFGKSTVQLSSGDPETGELVASLLPEGYKLSKWARTAGSTRADAYNIAKVEGSRPAPNGVMDSIRAMGLAGTKSEHKFIPEPYLLASPDERLEVLRGLLDADGYAGAAVEYSTVSPHLADGVEFLVRSLGGVTRRKIRQTHYRSRTGEKTLGKPSYRIIVTMPPEMNPFRLARKAEAWKAPWKYGPMRAIKSIEPAGQANVTCISVDAEDQLYVTEDFIVTHNTRQALAAAAIKRSRRTVIVVPPLVVENWCREAYAALGPGLKKIQPPEEPAIEPAPSKRKSKGKPKAPAKKPDFPAYIVPIRAGKKVPPFPEAGVVVVADSLLGSRPELLDDLIAWSPQAALFDEVHRSRTWAGKRATANRNLACSIDALRLPMTGTPFLQNPAEGVNMLAIAGLLDPVFGGASKFMETYTTQNHFGAFLPNRKMLPQLEEMLTRSCWVRRNKSAVLKQLPPKLRTTRYVEIDPKGFKAAHDTLYEKVTEWIEEQREAGEIISKETIKEFARSRVDLITPLRAAAGIAKIPAAIEIISDWMEATTEVRNGKKVYTRPLTVWVHHQPVMQALIEAVEKAGIADAGFIDGGVAQHKRQLVADKLQNGEIGVIFCSIGAAGFGITLTASSDTIFIETDWTPANISQAEDRNNRIGQTQTCMVTTLLATNTLDAHMRAILRNKAKDLDVMMPGADNNVTRMTSVLNEETNAYEVLTEEDLELERNFKSLGDIVENIVQDILHIRGYELAA